MIWQFQGLTLRERDVPSSPFPFLSIGSREGNEPSQAIQRKAQSGLLNAYVAKPVYQFRVVYEREITFF